MNEISEFYKKLILEGDFPEYLDFIARGNILLLPPELQMSAYKKNKDYSILNTVMGWKRAGYVVTDTLNGIKSQEKTIYDISQCRGINNAIPAEKLVWHYTDAKKLNIIKSTQFTPELSEKMYDNVSKIHGVPDETSKDIVKIYAFITSIYSYIVDSRLNSKDFGIVNTSEFLQDCLADMPDSIFIEEIMNIAQNNARDTYKFIYESIRENKIFKGKDALEKTTEGPVENPRAEGLETDKEEKYTLVDIKGSKSRYIANINAIKLLKELEAADRVPNDFERKILENYQGWGGCQEAFDDRLTTWNEEYKELKNLLSDEEYSQARSTVNTAFYTPDEVSKSIYGFIEKMGFKGGRILDPSMGTGRFFKNMPQEMRNNSQLYGVEIDSISGRIAKKLNADANIEINGYENVKYNNESFDLIISNVPFGDINIHDKDYKDSYKIHDYFFLKSLDKLRDGGIMAFITSKGTLDKKNSEIRELISQRADLAAAFRLPAGTFGDTKATSDILFLVKNNQKKEINRENWITVEEDSNGIPYNKYFMDNPNHMLGTMRYSSMYDGHSVTECVTDDAAATIYQRFDDVCSSTEPDNFINNNAAELNEVKNSDATVEGSIPFDQNLFDYEVKNNTCTILNDILYYRENDLLIPYVINEDNGISKKEYDIAYKLVDMKIHVIKMIEAMKKDCSDSELIAFQLELNKKYDDFITTYGYVSNNIRCVDDYQMSIVTGLEKKKIRVVNGKEIIEYEKGQIFTERTISSYKQVEHYDSVMDAFYGCVNLYDSVDFDFIESHTDSSKEDILKELLENKVIFIDPVKLNIESSVYESCELAEMYLSGNVREKLSQAKRAVELGNSEYDFTPNVEQLNKIMPDWIKSSDMKISIGSNLVRPDDYRDFICDLLEFSGWRKDYTKIEYEPFTSTYKINNKNFSGYNSTSKYGTQKINALEIFERLLNNLPIQVNDSYEEGGKRKYKINQKETILAKNKAEIISNQFEKWLFSSEERVAYYEDVYNNMFNSEVAPQYDGSHLEIPYMNEKIKLREHQKNAITRAIRGNTLIAHPVGAGKTYVMAGTCMKLKQIGAANKPLIVVPNVLVEQITVDFVDLFPSAQVLAVTKKDFEKKKRKEFISKIALGNYDAVIMGHSQFGLISISPERQKKEIEDSIKRIDDMLDNTDRGSRFTIKQLEKLKKSYRDKIQSLMNVDRKDDELYFEDLGVDALIVDEVHNFKNLEVLTKMTRIAGVQTSASQRSYDLYAKCKYIRELKGDKNILFSTGTPISNTVCEMYTWMRYLAEDKLYEKNLNTFDNWANIFTKIENVWEVAPEGDKFQSRDKINRFRNIPELKKMFLAFADVVLKENINLEVPEAHYHIVETEACLQQKEGQAEIVQRANALRRGGVDPHEDNMLKVCSDAKKLAIDPRLLYKEGEVISEAEWNAVGRTKLDAVVENVYDIYCNTSDIKGTQVIFSDLGTPADKKKPFNVYSYIKSELIKKGIPENEICFIHDAGNNKDKISQLHQDMRTGVKRIIIGSTDKLGTGTNIQRLLVAEHDIDCPWRPSDIEQREGRIVRQNNQNKDVHIYRYVTKGSFDSYNWNTVENKQRFISQIMDNNSLSEREHEDISEESMRFAEMVAAASGNPLMKERLDVDNELRKLEVLAKSYEENQRMIEQNVKYAYPRQIAECEQKIKGMDEDIKSVELPHEEFTMTISGKYFTDRMDAGEVLMSLIRDSDKIYSQFEVGTYRGFKLYAKSSLSVLGSGIDRKIIAEGSSGLKYYVDVTDVGARGIVFRIDNVIDKIPMMKVDVNNQLETIQQSYAAASAEYNKPFESQGRLEYLRKRKVEIESQLMEDENQLENAIDEEIINNPVKTI